MKIALAQLNSTVGAVRTNRLRIEDAYREARRQGAELVVTPELAIGGYPPRDLLEREAFVRACSREVAELAKVTLDGGAMLVGTLDPDDSWTTGKNLFNAAALLEGGEVVTHFHKSLLPTYDVFDEARYFEPAPPDSIRPFLFRGLRLGVTICEDVWNDSHFWSRQLYEFDPVQRLIDEGVDVLVNLSASPFHLGKQGVRQEMLGSLSRRAGVPVLHCNLIGGNDELVFDGASFAAWPDGEISHVASSFAEDLVLVDLAEGRVAAQPRVPPCDEEAAAQAIVLGVRDYFRKCGFSRAVVGLSGGIDSALTAALAVEALGASSVTGITMPSRYSSDGSVGDSARLAANLGIDFHEVPIGRVHDAYHTELAGLWGRADEDTATTGITDQNIQARIRGNILMSWSNRFGALVLSTGNKSELAVGYCTLYGDMAGGLAVISDLPKTFVYSVARWLNRDREIIPLDTITKPPSAELAPDQKDTDSLPSYETLDGILQLYLEEGRSMAEILATDDYPAETVQRVVTLVDRNEYKRRQAAPGIRVTTKAFGTGRRFPVAARLEHHSSESTDE